MATKEGLLTMLAGASGPMSRGEMEKDMDQSYRAFQVQLDRMVRQELLTVDGEHNYTITEKGREEALGEYKPEGNDGVGEPGSAGGKARSEESLGTTEYQTFIKYGRQTGVTTLDLIKQTADHIWNGGEYTDLVWVAQGLQQMGIRQDLRTRWFHSWRSYLKQPLPTNIPAEFYRTEAKKSDGKPEGGEKEATGLRDCILSEDNTPVRVGPGLGDLDYKDAVEISKIRAARGKGDGKSASTGSMADELIKMFTAFREMMGPQAAGKSYVVKPGENGLDIQEIAGNMPVIIPEAKQPAPATSYFLDAEGNVTAIDPQKPTVIIKPTPAPAPANGITRLIDRNTGEITEVPAGSPIIIHQQPPAAAAGSPIQMKDKEGNPMVLDLTTYIKLDEHKEKQRRDDETHQVKLEIGKGFRDLLKHAEKAITHMGDDES